MMASELDTTMFHFLPCLTVNIRVMTCAGIDLYFFLYMHVQL